MNVQEALKKCIEEKGIKQRHIAERLGINENTFSQMITGKRKIEADEFIDICLCIDVDVGELVNKMLNKKDGN